MIARTWRGATRAHDADAYLAYLNDTGLADYRSTPGNCGAFALRRETDGLAEFLLVSLWDSREAVSRFAGEDPERAVFYPEDDRYLVERDERVTHFEVLESAGAGDSECGGAEPPRTPRGRRSRHLSQHPVDGWTIAGFR